MEITQSLIDTFAPNPGASANGKELAHTGKYISLNRTEDSLLYFGECAGSGKNPYRCSVDFSGGQPVGRCSCPSRQIPCKHCVGLLYAALMGKIFAVADIPEEIASKRVKLEQRAEKKAERGEEIPKAPSALPTKTQLAALRKKTEAQLQGVNTAAQMLKNMIQMGLGAVDVRMRRSFDEQLKGLGNYYIPGVQAAFSALLLTLQDTGEDRLVKAVDQAAYLHALLRRGREYLEQKLDHPEPDVQTNIEELLGRAWKLDELRMYGCYIQDARLVQLCFNSYDNEAAAQTVEEGIWVCLNDGRVYKTRNYRPYRAAKFIKAEDSIFDIVETPELFIYPGGLNPRVRWEGCTFAPLNPETCAAVKNFAGRDYAAVIKTVKNQIRNPLDDKNPLALVHFSEFGRVKNDEGDVQILIRDENGVQILLSETNYAGRAVLPLVTSSLTGAKNEALLLLFENDLAAGMLAAQPLALVTGERIIRLLY